MLIYAYICDCACVCVCGRACMRMDMIGVVVSAQPNCLDNMTYIIQICRPVKETYTNGPQSHTHMTSVASNQLSQWHIVVLSLFHSDVANHYG